MNPTDYILENVSDAHRFTDKGWTISDPDCNVPSLVRAKYSVKSFLPDDSQDGLYRYHNWLPIQRTLSGSCAPVTYKSTGLAGVLGLKNLYITMSGWAPDKDCRFKTCSFKETEAYSVCGRLPKDEKRILVVASAGNTARAFAHVCSENNIPLVVAIPRDNMNAMWFESKLNPCVKIIASPEGSDYFDAIQLADKLCSSERFLAEGGAKNIARRDGMGTTLLSAVETIGRVPDCYFQAVGSGTGAIAAWENNLRLIEDGRFGSHKMRLMLSQNVPFTLMYDSWLESGRTLVDFTAQQAREASAKIKAKVLSNRKPPYSLAGGLYDALTDTDGKMYKVTNDELDKWKNIFLEKEGIDIYSAAAVAVASLAQSVANGDVSPEDTIMLNITGCGEKARLEQIKDTVYRPEPDLVMDPETHADQIIQKVEKLFD